MAIAVKKKKGRRRGGSTGSSGVETSPFRPIHDPKTPPCILGCPNGNNIRGMLTVMAQAEAAEKDQHQAIQEAFDMFAVTQPFLSVCGRVCPHPCEADCNRTHKEGAVSINKVERYVGDYALKHNFPVKKFTEEEQAEKVAIVGAGPAGLSCAYQLALRGYKPVVFEQFDKAGGMLRYGIPDYRLPADILDQEIARIEGLGVEVKLNTRIGTDIQYDNLKNDFDAIFVGMGAHKGRLLGIPNEDAPNIYTGVEFLNRINAGKTIDVGDKVLVVGGGDTAMDAARVSKRLGADVTLVYRRTRNEMPAIEEDIVGGEEEGIKFEFLSAPIEFIKEGDKITKMKCQRMELGEPDASGRRRPVPIDGDFYEIETTCVVSAISQAPNFDGLDMLHEGKDWVKIDEDGKTTLDKTFAGGDNIDLALVITAIAHGRTAAEAIVRAFKGIEKEPAKPDNVVTRDKMVLSYYEEKQRNEPEHLSPEERLKALDLEITSTFTDEMALLEAQRCMSCGACFDCGTCWSLCQDQAIHKPIQRFAEYSFKLDVCKGCNKCAENCPCGYIEMKHPITGEFAPLNRMP